MIRSYSLLLFSNHSVDFQEKEENSKDEEDDVEEEDIDEEDEDGDDAESGSSKRNKTRRNNVNIQVSKNSERDANLHQIVNTYIFINIFSLEEKWSIQGRLIRN